MTSTGITLTEELAAEEAARGAGSTATDFPGEQPISMEEAMGEAPVTASEEYAAAGAGDDSRRLQQLADQDQTQPDLGLGDQPAGYDGSGMGYPGDEPDAGMQDPGAPFGAEQVLNPGRPLTDEEILANEVPPELEPVPDSETTMLNDVYQGGDSGRVLSTPKMRREQKFARTQPIYAKFKRKYESYRRSDVVRLLQELDSKRADGLTADMRVAYVALLERLEELDNRRQARKRSK